MTKPITMIEIFSGIGAQAKALSQLPIEHEVVATMDVEKDAIVSYASMRYDLEKEIQNYDFPSKEEMVSELQRKNVGFDFAKNKHSITIKTNIDKVKQYYIADRLSRNLGDVSLQKELPYVDIIVHSSPCQDYSQAGKGAGGDEGSGTRSSLMFESLRLIATSKPKFVVWENVSAVLNDKHRHNFLRYLEKMSELGYENAFDLLNGKNFGVPQNRLRIFCVSRRIDPNDTTVRNIDDMQYGSNKQVEKTMKEIKANPNIRMWTNYKFPKTIPLQHRLKDVLEKHVDEKYYINNEKTEALLAQLQDKLEATVQTIKVSNQATVVDGFTDEAGTLMARDWKGFGNQAMTAVVEPQIDIVGNYMPSNHDASRIVSIDGLAPTVKENHGTVTAILEPFIVASRGRDSDNPDVNTEQKLEPNMTGCTNTITSVQKDNWVAEPTRLGNIYGEQFGTGYAGNVWDTNGISPALMTMQGGNRQPLVVEQCEPELVKIGQLESSYEQSGRVYSEDGIAPTIMSNSHGSTNGGYTSPKIAVREPMIYDDYNSRIPQDQNVITTLTTNCGASATRNGVKIIEPIVCEQRCDEGLRLFKDDVCGTLRTIDAGGDKRVVEPGIRWRIRKLTEKECWRLMGFSDEDVDRAAQFCSPSALYKQAGNSIITACLVAIFYSLLFNDNSTEWAKYVVDFNS